MKRGDIIRGIGITSGTRWVGLVTSIVAMYSSEGEFWGAREVDATDIRTGVLHTRLDPRHYIVINRTSLSYLEELHLQMLERAFVNQKKYIRPGSGPNYVGKFALAKF